MNANKHECLQLKDMHPGFWLGIHVVNSNKALAASDWPIDVLILTAIAPIRSVACTRSACSGWSGSGVCGGFTL